MGITPLGAMNCAPTTAKYPAACGEAPHRKYQLAFLYLVGMITTMKSADVIKRLEADGWVLRSVRGSHHIFNHPAKPGHLSVPHPKRDLGKGLLHKLFKQAGLKNQEAI